MSLSKGEIRELEPIRVAAIIEEGKMGGPQVYMIHLAHQLAGKIKTVVIMPVENSDDFQERCRKLEVPFTILPLTRITKVWKLALLYLMKFPWEIIQLVRLFRRERFDLIHVSGGSWQYKGAFAGKLAGLPVLWHLNDTSMPLLFLKIFGLLSGLATGYTYTSERTKYYYKPYVKKGRFECTIPAPVDTNCFDPSVSLEEDELAPWLEDKLVIGTVANPSPVKDLETFLRMAASFQDQHTEDLAFVVVGKVHDSQKEYFRVQQKLASNFGLQDLHWAGSRQDVRPLLQRLDVYVCSSKAESSPISVWEALSMAKPVVSTDVGDVSQYIQEGQNGFVVPIGDAQALASKVQLLLADPELRYTLGQHARQVARQYLDVSHCGESHLDAYQLLVSK